MQKRLVRILVALSLFLVVFTIDKLLVLSNLIAGGYGFILPMFLYLVIYLLIGYDVLWRAIRNLGRGQFFDENFLMMLATLGAFGLAIYRGVNGQVVEGFDEACAVLIFYQIGEWFQKYATGKSRQSIAALMEIRPDYANVKIDGKWQQVDPSEVSVGTIILVNPGERIPLDGDIVSGSSSLDAKSLTGETLPQEITVGDSVASGCINLTAQIEIRVTKIYCESTVAKLLDLVETAAVKKSKSENFITKFARYYTPIVVSAALCLAIIPSLITWNWARWIYRALEFLVVSCPCALVISVPMAFFVALGTASKYGVLVKGSGYLERLNQANIFVFDKTGTLTKGNFMITKIIPQTKQAEILELAAIAEYGSNHPIAQSILAAYGKPVVPGWTLTNVAGAGVIATSGIEKIYCGNEKLMQLNHIKYTPLTDVGTVVYVAKDQTFVGAILITDEIKPETKSVISTLNHDGVTIMLTGDNAAVAASIAEKSGVKEYYASLLPEDKVQHVEAMFAQKNLRDCLCYLGDGINDAPVLMRADVGVAMGGLGSDAAIEAADVVLMRDDLRSVLFAKRLAKKTMTIVRQNIWGSLIVKVGILALAALGLTNMWLAVFGDVGVAMLAILNAMRLNKKACR